MVYGILEIKIVKFLFEFRFCSFSYCLNDHVHQESLIQAPWSNFKNRELWIEIFKFGKLKLVNSSASFLFYFLFSAICHDVFMDLLFLFLPNLVNFRSLMFQIHFSALFNLSTSVTLIITTVIRKTDMAPLVTKNVFFFKKVFLPSFLWIWYYYFFYHEVH